MFDDPIVWYLFLGGSGAGAVAVLAALDLARGRALRTPEGASWARSLDRPLLARGLTAGTVVLALGTLCLLIDLGQPERFYYVIVHPTPSVLTFGSYALALTVACAATLSVIALFNLARTPLLVVRALEAGAVVLGTATMAYTGVFLASIGFVPLWNNLALPLLFALSSYSVGIACALGCAAYEGGRRSAALPRLLRRAEMIALALEAGCLVAYLATTAGTPQGAAAVEALLRGELGWLFWLGFAGAGLALPLVFDIACSRMNSALLTGASIACVLAGGFALRYCIVNAPMT